MIMKIINIKNMRQFIHKWGSPKYFYHYAGRLLPWFCIAAISLFSYGLVGALYLAPPDYQQGDGFRIIYVHVPAAFMSLGIYSLMTFAAIVGFIWKIKLSDIIIKTAAPLGAWFTFLALVTGAIWGKPMWGTYWVWDARLTSELILLVIYFGLIALREAIPDKELAAKATGIFTIVGFVNIPIIHFSVYWWNTLHQGDTIQVFGKSLMAPSMLHPLLAMILAFIFFFGIVLLMRMRLEIIKRANKTLWVREFLQS